MSLLHNGKTDGGRSRLREAIQSGRYLTGTYLPSVRELAAELELSKSSVHNILKLLQEEDLVKIYPGCGALVLQNDPAKGGLKRVFVRPSDFGSFQYLPVTRELLAGVAAGAEKKDCEMAVSFSDSGRMTDDIIARHMRGEIQGVIYLQCRDADSLITPLKHAGIPCVVASGELSAPGVPCCTVDFAAVARAAAKYLSEHGCLKLGLVCGPLDSPMSRTMIAGFAAGAEMYGVDFSPETDVCGEIVYGGEDAENVAKLTAFLARRERPSGIFTVRDFRARLLYEAADVTGLRIPFGLSVVSYDGHSWPGAEAAGLTTFEEPLSRMGEASVEMLKEWNATGKVPETRIFAVNLLERASVRNA